MARGPITVHLPDGPVPVRPTRGLLRVHVALPADSRDRPDGPGFPGRSVADDDTAAARTDVSALRALLVADVLLRVAELHALPAVFTCDPAPSAALTTALSAVGGHPPQPLRADTPEPAAGHVDVLIRPTVTPAPAPAPICLTVAPALGAAGAAAPAGSGTDPLALRLLLLGAHRRAAVRVTTAALQAAAATLASWRAAVATWAEQPSAPMPAGPLARLRTAWDTDLDTPAVIAELDRLAAVPADGDPAPGSRFELFSHADRVLAVDLVRDVGRG